MSEAFTQALLAGAAEMGFSLDTAQTDKCARFADILVAANERMNLTAITDPAEMAIKHYLDSFTCLLAGTWPANALCADVGTGAGFPGIPLAILRPETHWVLLDSLAKRVDFLKQAVGELGLGNVACHQMRAEDAGGTPGLREKFSIVTARAVAQLPVLVEYCLPLVRVGGWFIAMKGPQAAAEAEGAQHAITVLGGAPPQLQQLSLPGEAGARTLVAIQKQKPTPRTYPRRAGIPAKNPL